MESIELSVSLTQKSVRVDKYISEQDNNMSRSRIQQLIENGNVFLNRRQVKRVSEKVKEGDQIQLLLPPPEPSSVEPEDIHFDILYQDTHLAVINKPAGLSVHPTDHQKSGTLVNGLLYHLKDLSGIGGVLRPGIVHRLDRVTSGALLVAKTDEAHRILSEGFKSRKIKKIYRALVHGEPHGGSGEIDQPIGRDSADRKKMCIRPDGRKSLTRYKICGRGLGGSFVELYPYTGRTHQIRVHMKHILCPIAGDALYSTRKTAGKGELERLFEGYPGIGLHAFKLAFCHPITGESLEFEAPMPELFLSIIARMK